MGSPRASIEPNDANRHFERATPQIRGCRRATAEQPTAPVFIDGRKAMTLRGPTLAQDFQKIVVDYIERRYGAGRDAAE